MMEQKWTEDMITQLCKHFLGAEPEKVRVLMVQGYCLVLPTFPLFDPLGMPILGLSAPPPLDLPDRRIDLRELIFEEDQGGPCRVWAGYDYGTDVLAIKG